MSDETRELGEDAPTMTSFAEEEERETAFAQTVGAVLEGGEHGPLAAEAGTRRYERRRMLGEGGMGRVLEASDRQFGRAVAIKELRDGARGGLVARFQVEALVTANLEHPGIPAVYERGVDDRGLPFYAMRLVRGTTLSAVMAEAQSLEERLKLLPVLVRTAQTVAFAHERGVVHRDIKPDNILVGAHGQTTLLDWGIAKVRGMPSHHDDEDDAPKQHGSTRHGAVMGTPAYMAPEQAAGEVDRVDARTDVFALGAILHHLLAGEPPYRGVTVQDVVEMAREGRGADIDRVARQVPASLREIVKKAMRKEPTLRYQSAKELVEALEGFIAGAVSGRDSPAVRVVVNVGTALALLGIVAGIVAAFSAMPTVRELGAGAVVVFLLSVAGITISGVELRTRGRHHLSWLGLAFAITTLLVGVGGAFDGLTRVLTFVAQDEILSNVDKWREILTTGSREALGNIAPAAQLAALQFLLWGIAKRRVARGGGSQPAVR